MSIPFPNIAQVFCAVVVLTSAAELAVADLSAFKLQLGHERQVNAIALNSDGTRLFTSSDRGRAGPDSVIAFDTITGRELFDVQHKGAMEVSFMKVSKNGQFIVVCSQGYTGYHSENNVYAANLLLDASDGHRIHTFTKFDSAQGIEKSRYHSNCAAFSPDGDFVVIGSSYRDAGLNYRAGAVRLWDLETGKLRRQINIGDAPITSVVVSPDGRYVIAADRAGYVSVREATSGAKRARFQAFACEKNKKTYNDETKAWDDMEVGRIAYRGESDELVVAYVNRLAIWNPLTERIIRSWTLEDKNIEDLAVTNDGKYALVTTGTRTKKIDLKTGEVGKVFAVPEGITSDLRLSADNKTAAVLTDGKSFRRRDSDTGKVHIWDMPTNSLRNSLAVRPYSHESRGDIGEARFSPDGKQLLVEVHSDTNARILHRWSLADARLVSSTKLPFPTEKKSEMLACSQDGTLVLQKDDNDDNELVTLWDAVKNKPLNQFKTYVGAYRSWAAISPTNETFVTSFGDFYVTLWNIDKAENLGKLDIKQDKNSPDIQKIQYSTNGKRVAVQTFEWVDLGDIKKGGKGRIVVYDVATKSMVFDTDRQGKQKWRHEFALSPDGKQIVFTSGGSDVKQATIWDIDTSTVRATMEHEENFGLFTFSPDSTKVASARGDFIGIWDTATGKLVSRNIRCLGKGSPTALFGPVKEQEMHYVHLAFSPDGKRLLHHEKGNYLAVSDVQTGRLIAVLVLRRVGQDWIVLTPSGYFHGCEELVGRVGWSVSGQTFPLELFEHKFRRPDIIGRVLSGQEVGHTDAGSANLLPPKVSLTVEKFDAREIHVQVVAQGNKANIKNVRLYIDGREATVLDQIAADRQQNSATRVEYRATVDFPPGKTKAVMAATATDQNGITSPPVVQTIVIPGATTSVERTLYVLSVGVSKYDNSQLNLNFSDADAKALAKTFKKQAGHAFQHVETKVLVNEVATADGIRDGLNWLENSCQRKDTAIVLFSGHGTRDQEGKLYYVPHDADPQDVAQTFLPWNDVSTAMRSTRASSIIFFSDCCHSGAFGFTQASQGELASPLQKEAGVMVFCSSRGLESSLEMGSLKHGAFTYAILNGLSGAADLIPDRRITISELQTYVSNRVKQVTEDRQHPHIPLMNRFDPETVIAHVQ